MGWIISMVLAVVLCTIASWIGVALRKAGQREQIEPTTDSYERRIDLQDAKNMKLGGLAIIGSSALIFFLWAGLHTVVATIHIVPAGHNGVVREFGAIVAQTEDGFQLIPPWRNLENADTRVQTWVFADEPTLEDGQHLAGPGLSSFSKETQDVFIDATLNIEVSPGDIQELYRNVGADYFAKIVPTRARQLFKNETVNYRTVDIAPNREQITADVEAALAKELTAFSIEVVGLQIDNISFDADFVQAIEDKQIASQEALRQEEIVKAKEAEAQQAIAIAIGEAEANRVLAESLSEQGNFILQFRAIEKLAEDVRIILLPADSGLIPLLGSDLLSGAGPAPQPPR